MIFFGNTGILADNNNNVLVGTEEDDEIRAYGSQDQVVGLGGNDRINGGEGKHAIRLFHE